MSDTPILYSFRRCPYAMRARMALTASNTKVRLREIVLRDKPEEMLEASPKGTVPVLIDDNTVIDESINVMRWALGRNDPEQWLCGDDKDLIAACDGEFKHHLDRYKYATRYEDADPDEHRTEGMKFIHRLADRLASQPYLNGDERSLADIAIFPFIRQFRIADTDWFDENAPEPVRDWLKRLMESDLFKSIMAKYPLWKETGEEIAFPA